MKKLTLLVVLSLLLFSLVACKKNQDKSTISKSSISSMATTEENSSILEEKTSKLKKTEIPENHDFLKNYTKILDNTQDVIFEHENETVSFIIPQEWNYYFVSRNYPESNFTSIGLINENHDSIISITKNRSENYISDNNYDISRTNINNKTYTLYKDKGYGESIMIVPYKNTHYAIGYNSVEFSDYDKQVLYNILASLQIQKVK